ncbi:fumarylacetoacetate hydrolase family protein [Novosphingobium sp.]|uniref:fumarylacetoacetate hydrolase family protein n=1 Tax=Novosphingobium sp. TaxID=1874826 RepID=UPI003BAD5436
MKLAQVDYRGRSYAAAVVNGKVIDLGLPTVAQVLGSGKTHADPGADSVPLQDVALLPPVSDQSRILCAGFNYRSHSTESGVIASKVPTFFTRFASSLVGHRTAIIRPSVSEMLDWEGEIAVVIGRGGHRISAASAMSHVAGYVLFGDHSVRDFQLHGSQATAGKNFDASGAIGPWIVTSDEAGEVDALAFTTTVNGRIMQIGVLADLVHTVPALLAYVSTFMRLRVGDVIATGTPAGIGGRRQPPIWLRPGDTVQISSPQLGDLTNPVVAENATDSVKGASA